jgi:hypothetical protein
MTQKYAAALTMTRTDVEMVFHGMGLPQEDIAIFWREAQKHAAKKLGIKKTSIKKVGRKAA